MTPLAGVGSFDVFIGRQVGARQIGVEASQADDAPDGEEANDDDYDAGRGLADGVDKRGVVAVVAFGLGQIGLFAKEYQVGHSAREDEDAQGGQGYWKGKMGNNNHFPHFLILKQNVGGKKTRSIT